MKIRCLICNEKKSRKGCHTEKYYPGTLVKGVWVPNPRRKAWYARTCKECDKWVRSILRKERIKDAIKKPLKRTLA